MLKIRPIMFNPSWVRVSRVRRQWILGLVLIVAGCTKYTAIPDDGGDGQATDGGSDQGALVDQSQDSPNTGDAPPDGGADRAGLPDAVGDTTVDAAIDATPDAVSDTAVDTAAPPDLSKIAAPRLIAPLSTSTVTSRRPLLHWTLASGTDGAHVQICRDRACTNPITAFDASGASGAPAIDLPTGVVFWHASGRSGGLTGTPSTPTWQFNVGARSAPVNTSWGTTLDVNGDGYADVVVGADNAAGSNGKAYLYQSSAPGLATSQEPVVLIGTDGTNSLFGRSVASAGDVNGDGFADLIIGARGAVNFTGRAYVYLGSALGLSASQQPTVLTGPDGANGFFGDSVATAGDVNGDGYADVIIAAFGVANGTGRSYVYLGSATGLSSAQQPTVLTAPDGQGSAFGNSTTGDINGDGYADIVVGAPGVLSSTGRAYLYLGGASGLTRQPVALTGSDGTNGRFGQLTSSSDVNGDGYADVFIGTLVGRSYLYLGGAPGLTATQAPVVLASSGPVASAGDINGDGYGDIMIGANVFLGGASAIASTQQPVALTNADGSLAETVTSAGDINGDGYTDVIIGNGDYMNCLGRAYIYLGSASGPFSTQQPIVLTGTDVVGDFAVAVAMAEAKKRLERLPPGASCHISKNSQKDESPSGVTLSSLDAPTLARES